MRPGERVLGNAADDSLGTVLVSMLKELSAEVVGAACGARKLDFIRDWGADDVVDYSALGCPERARRTVGKTLLLI